MLPFQLDCTLTRFYDIVTKRKISYKNDLTSKLNEGKFQKINRGEKIEHDDEVKGKENEV
jgi:hypothetical protein